MNLAMAIVSFLLGGLSYRLYIKKRKPPEPTKLEIGNHVKIVLDGLSATGVFLGWHLQANIVGPKGRVVVDQDGTNVTWLINPENISYLGPGENKKLVIEPKNFEN